MLANLPIARVSGARILFFGAGLVTVAIALWAKGGVDTRGVAGELTPIFLFLFSTYDYAGALCGLLILIAAALVPARFSFRPLLRWIGEHPVKVASLTTAVLCAGAGLVYRNHPLSMDEFSPLFQSEIFASGHLTGQFPTPLLDWLIPPPFQEYFLNVSHANGNVTSSYWPSFALLLTPFTALGIPWACNPFICGLTLLAAHRLALRIFHDVETAGLSILLTVASPVFFADGISYYSMSAHLLANTVYALLLSQPTPHRAFMAGLVGSVALTLHNPVPHILFAVPWFLWIARQPDSARRVGALLAGYLPLVLLLGFGWFVFASQLTHEGTGVTAAAATADSYVSVGGAFRLPTASVLLARAIAIGKVCVWAVPGLVILAGIGGWRWRRHPLCRLLTASALVTLLGYLIIPFDQGHGWGYRYFHSAWIVLAILGAGALAPMVAPESDRNIVFADPSTRTFVVACALLTLTLGVGLRAVQMRQFISESMSQEPAYAGTERRVIIIDPTGSFYGQDLIRNDPWLRGNTIRMITHGPAADAQMMRANFPELHRVWAGRFGSVWSAAPTQAVGSPR